MTTESQLAEAFEPHRTRLLAVAHRVLGSQADAEDAVQEAWLRLSRQDPEEIDNLPGWLTTVVSRICIDTLRSRAARPEVSIDREGPELVVTDDVDTPEDAAVLSDSVGLALLVVLGSLRPDERLAFVLHDMFAVPFAEIGRILDKSTDAAKMLASRARRKVQQVPTSGASRQEQREVVDAFLAASRSGDFDALLRILDPDVVLRSHTPRGVQVSVGPEPILDRIRQGQGSQVRAGRVLVNGEPGIMAWSRSGRPISLMACTVADGRLVGAVAIVDPAQLAALDLPGPPAAADDEL